MYWNEWKISFSNFAIFILWVMVVYVLEIHQNWTNFGYKNDYISKKNKSQKSENYFFIRFSIFHVKITTFEILKVFVEEHLLFQPFLFSVGGFARHTPYRGTPLDPACFWIEDPSLIY